MKALLIRDGVHGARGGCTFCSLAALSADVASSNIVPLSNNWRTKSDSGSQRSQTLSGLHTFSAYQHSLRKVQVLWFYASAGAFAPGIIVRFVCWQPARTGAPDAVLDLLGEYMNCGYEVWLSCGATNRARQNRHIASIAVMICLLSAHDSWLWANLFLLIVGLLTKGRLNVYKHGANRRGWHKAIRCAPSSKRRHYWRKRSV